MILHLCVEYLSRKYLGIAIFKDSARKGVNVDFFLFSKAAKSLNLDVPIYSEFTFLTFVVKYETALSNQIVGIHKRIVVFPKRCSIPMQAV